MATITPKTFPGVYTTIVDKSFFTPVTSNFKPGLIGVATKGAFDTPIVVTSLKDFVNKFGRPLTTTYTTDSATDLTIPDGGGFFLADAVDAMSDFVTNITVVRIGNRYTDLEPADGYTLGAFTYTLFSPFNAPRIQALKATGDVYLRVSQPGLPTTVNVSVVSAGGGTIAIDTAGDSFGAAYGPDAQIDYSIYDKAANQAEGVLYAYTYGTSAGQLTDAVYTSVGSISGYKNQFQLYCSANASASVLPCEMHPGIAGHSTTSMPDSSRANVTISFMSAPPADCSGGALDRSRGGRPRQTRTFIGG